MRGPGWLAGLLALPACVPSGWAVGAAQLPLSKFHFPCSFPCAGEGHVAAVKKVLESPELRCVPYNLGTGTGERCRQRG